MKGVILVNIENARKIIDDSTTMTAVEVLAFTEAIEQLAEAKRLLKAAMSDLAEAETCGLCKYEADDIATCKRKPINCFVWRYADEAEKLLKK